MTNVSTRFTVFLKFFLPTMWIVFFGVMTLTILFDKEVDVTFATQITMVIFFLSGAGILYWAFMRLKRVEMDETHLYVTNYHKMYKYPYTNIERLEILDFWLLKAVKVYFKVPGYFGKKVVFLAGHRFLPFIRDHASVANQLQGKLKR